MHRSMFTHIMYDRYKYMYYMCVYKLLYWYVYVFIHLCIYSYILRGIITSFLACSIDALPIRTRFQSLHKLIRK